MSCYLQKIRNQDIKCGGNTTTRKYNNILLEGNAVAYAFSKEVTKLASSNACLYTFLPLFTIMTDKAGRNFNKSVWINISNLT